MILSHYDFVYYDFVGTPSFSLVFYSLYKNWNITQLASFKKRETEDREQERLTENKREKK